MSYILGVLSGVALCVVFPDVALISAGALRKAWAKLNEWRKGP